jgi:hypothetical protein
MILYRKRLDRRALNEIAWSRKNNAREAAVWALHHWAVRICVDSASAPENSSCTTSRATIRDVFVGLGGLKNEEKSFDMHHGENKNHRPWCISNHGATSTSAAMATFLVVMALLEGNCCSKGAKIEEGGEGPQEEERIVRKKSCHCNHGDGPLGLSRLLRPP